MCLAWSYHASTPEMWPPLLPNFNWALIKVLISPIVEGGCLGQKSQTWGQKKLIFLRSDLYLPWNFPRDAGPAGSCWYGQTHTNNKSHKAQLETVYYQFRYSLHWLSCPSICEYCFASALLCQHWIFYVKRNRTKHFREHKNCTQNSRNILL